MTKKIVFTFGRFSPPTKAHEMLINKVMACAKELSADYQVCISHTVDAHFNPLTWEHKAEIIQNMFPGINLLRDDVIRTPFNVVEHYGKLGYTDITLIVGSDRIKNFTTIKKYTDEWGIKEFSIISAGDRDGDSPYEVFGNISSSRTREYVYNNDYSSFSEQLSESLSSDEKQKIFDKIKESRTIQILEGKINNSLTIMRS